MGKKKTKTTCSTSTDLPDNKENPSSHQANTAQVNAKSKSPKGANKGSETLTNALHGNIFQSKLLMLFLFRAIDLGYEDFKLSTENQKRFGKFDDVIFEYKKGTQTRIRLVQAKHKKDDEVKIKTRDLFERNKNKDEFSLRKYFQSFRDDIMKGSDYESIDDYVVCTNVSFDETSLKDGAIELEELTTKDDFLQFDGSSLEKIPRRYKFKKTPGIRGRLMEDAAPSGEEVHYTEQDVDRFLDKLVFAVGSPNEQELGHVLKKLMGNHLSLSDSEFQNALFFQKMLDWFKAKVISSLDQDDGKKYLDEIKQRIESIRLTGVSIDYQHKLNSLVGFGQSAITEMADTLNQLLITIDNGITVQHIVSESPKYTAAKVSAAIKKLDRFKNDDSFLMMSRELLSEGDRVNKIKKVLGLEGSPSLIVVVCEEESSDGAVEFYSNLIPEEKRNERRIILIRRKCCDRDKNLHKEDSIAYEQLNDETKKNLLSKSITFQGVETSVRELISSHDDNELHRASSVFDSNGLVELLFDKRQTTIEIPSQHQSSRFEESTAYIERRLRRCTGPRDPRFWAEVAERLTKTTDRKWTVNELKMECKWDETSHRINWLKMDDTTLQVFKAISDTILKTNSHFTDVSEVEESQLVNELEDSEITIISGAAGTGKSTILSHLYENIKLRQPNRWVIRIDLLNQCEVIEKFDRDQLDVVDFFVKHWSDLTLGGSQFAKRLFAQRLEQNGNVTFLFDGFDEIGSDLQNKTIELIRALQQKKAGGIYVTTRSHMNEKLEHSFFQFACRLQNFDTKDQTEFLNKYWSKVIKPSETEHSEAIQTLAEFLVCKTSKSLNDQDSEFIGIPLQCRILAECFAHELQVALKNNEPLTSLTEKFDVDLDLVKLYQLMMKTKREIYCREKTRTNLTTQSFVEDAVDKGTQVFLRKLAITSIIETKDDATNLLAPSKIEHRDQGENDEQFGLSYGLLQRNRQGKLEFLHRTYAEYLVADYIYQGFHLDDDNQLLNSKAVRNLLVGKIFREDLYEGVMRFLNCMLKSLVESDDWKLIMSGQGTFPNRLKLTMEVVCKSELSSKDAILGIAKKRNFAHVVQFTCDCVDVYFKFDVLRNAPSFQVPVGIYLLSLLDVTSQSDEKVQNAIFRRLLSIFESLPDGICGAIFKKLRTNMKRSLSRRKWGYHLSRWNDEEKKKIVECALDFMTRHRFEPTNPLDSMYYDVTVDTYRLARLVSLVSCNTYSLVKFFFCNDYYDTILPALLDYLLVFRDDDLVNLLVTSFRRYACRRHWTKERCETLLKRIVEFVKTKRSVLIKGLLREILVIGDKRLVKELDAEFDLFDRASESTVLHRAAFRNDLQDVDKILSTKDQSAETIERIADNFKNQQPTPFYVAASCDNKEICCKFLHFFAGRCDCKVFLLDALGDAILFKNTKMFRAILEAAKKVFEDDDFQSLLQSHMAVTVEYYKHRHRQRENATVFVVTDGEEMFNAMIDIIILTVDKEEDSSDSEKRKRLNNLFFQDEETFEKLALLDDRHLGFLVPKDEFEDWLKSLLNSDVERGFGVLIKHLVKFDRNQHAQLLKVITETDSEDDVSFWNQWFAGKAPGSGHFEGVETLLQSISNHLGVETLIEELLLHDEGYAIGWGLDVNATEVENIFNNLSTIKENVLERFAARWIPLLPSVIRRISSVMKFDSVAFTLSMMLENATIEQLSDFVDAILEKPVWFHYVKYEGYMPTITDRFLELVATTLGDSALDKLIFVEDGAYMKTHGQVVEKHDLLHALLSKLNGRHRGKVGDVLVDHLKCCDSFNETTLDVMNIFPFLVNYSDELHVTQFIDVILATKRMLDLPFDDEEPELLRMTSIWSEYLLNITPYTPKETIELVVSIFKWVHDTLRSREYLDKLMFHEQGILITRVLLFKGEKLMSAITEHLPVELQKEIAKCLFDNMLQVWLDVERASPNRCVSAFLRKHVGPEELAKCVNNIINENDKHKQSIWTDRLCYSVQDEEEFWNFLSCNVDADLLKQWLCSNAERLAKMLNVKFFELILHDYLLHDCDTFWHQVIEQKLHNCEHDWFTLLPLLRTHGNAQQVSKLIDVLVARHKPSIESSLNIDVGNWSTSIWGDYVYHEDKCNTLKQVVSDLMDCVFQTTQKTKMDPIKLKQLVMHSPSEGGDPVVVRAALNGEHDVVEAMLKHLNRTKDRKEIEALIKQAQNQEEVRSG